MIATPNQAAAPLQSEPSAHIAVPCFRGCPLPPPGALGIVQGPMWAHRLVLDMIKAALPLPALAEHLKIPFRTLIGYIDSPDVQAEIDALDRLTLIRARLLGDIARPVSIRRLLGILERPDPEPRGDDPDADAKHLLRHDELIRRTATTIAKESRALAAKPASISKPQKGAPSAPSHASSGGSSTTITTDDRAREQVPSNDTPDRVPPAQKGVPPVPVEHVPMCGGCETELVPESRALPDTTHTPGRHEAPSHRSQTDALRSAAGSTRSARDRPAA